MTEPRIPPDVDVEEPEGDMSRWKVDRHVPIALIASLAIYALAQTATTAYWVASINGRVQTLEQRAEISAPLGERMVKVETKLDMLGESMTEIKNLLRQPGR